MISFRTPRLVNGAAACVVIATGCAGKPTQIPKEAPAAVMFARDHSPQAQQSSDVEADPADETCSSSDEERARRESWGKHFAVYEELPSGERIALGESTQYYDTHSTLVIQRSSEAPEIRATNGVSDDRNDSDPAGFDVDVIVLRRIGDHMCRIIVHVPGLQDRGGYDPLSDEGEGCPRNVKVFTQPKTIGKGIEFRVPAGTLIHGDQVQVQLTGRYIGEETFPKRVVGDKVKVTARSSGKETEREYQVSVKSADGDKADAYLMSTRKICGDNWTANLAAIDFSAITPMQDWYGTRRRLIEQTDRADNRFGVYFDFDSSAAPSLATGIYGSAITISATAIDSTGKSRDLPLRKNESRPTLETPRDGETVVIKIARKFKSATGTTGELTQRTYSFTAIAGGLHAAREGDRKAGFGTTSALMAVFDASADSSIFGFAQTLSYTATRRTIYPGFFDEFGFGIHASILARKTDDESTDDNPLSWGLGAHVSFGSNSVQLGTGWDFLNDKAYVLVGISLPEFATFFSQK